MLELWEIYTTREVSEGSALHDVVILHRSGKESDEYSPARIQADLSRYIPKGLTDTERLIILNHIEHRIEEHVAQVRKSMDPPQHAIEIRVGHIVDLALQGFVDATHRSWHGHSDGQDRARVAHAMYALATLGRGQWKTVQQFIDWTDTQYPHLRRRATTQPPTPRPSTIKWTLPQQTRPTSIQRVVTNKRYSPTGDGPARRTKRDFDEGKMRQKIARAFQGREKNGNRTEQVVEYVLWGLIGQQVVRTSQLSSAIAEALRGMDGIAYLRWVAIGKELDLAQLYDEAMSLLSHPSPPLRDQHPHQGSTPHATRSATPIVDGR